MERSCEDSEKAAICEPKREASEETKPADFVILDCQAAELWGNTPSAIFLYGSGTNAVLCGNVSLCLTHFLIRLFALTVEFCEFFIYSRYKSLVGYVNCKVFPSMKFVFLSFLQGLLQSESFKFWWNTVFQFLFLWIMHAFGVIGFCLAIRSGIFSPMLF